MKRIFLIPGLFFCLLLLGTDWLPVRSIKSAYEHHYKGSLYYKEDQFGKAERHFRIAYNTLPNNFAFALSYAACLGRNGDPELGLKIMQRGSLGLDRSDPEYEQKRALKTFFIGFLQCYAKQYGSAVNSLKRSISLQEPIGNPAYLSLFYNALGYAILLNQGSGAHNRADLAPHYHVHKRDMERAFAAFENALEYNPANPSAQYNYQTLRDSLQISGSIDVATTETVENAIVYKSLEEENLQSSIFKTLEFSKYDEVLFLLDISGSMVMEKVVCKGKDRFDVMKETALHILDRLDRNTQMGIATIGGDCGTEPKLWHETGSLDHKQLKRKLEFLVPDGTTPLLTILQETPPLFSDKRESEKVIFFISDGANVCRSNVDICEWTSVLRQRGITLHIFTFLDATFNHANAFAEYTCLADLTKGKILYMDNLRCKIQRHKFVFAETADFKIPPFERVQCWGPAVEHLWAVFEQ
jgi:tetratricopeptide (TPR) repeat protein